MRQSFLFTKTRKEAPKDEVSKNAQLLIRAGYIHKEMAGVYSYLPLGLRVGEKIAAIIREEMNALGGQEVGLSILQNKELWQKTDRWDDTKVDNWFKTTLKAGGEAGLSFTNEEPLANAMREYIQSYKDLPKYVYQINLKFRNEQRAKSGILRGREFLMKDMYSFHINQEDLNKYYEQVALAYQRIFVRVGIGEKTYKTFASGGVFSKYSHEFQTLCSAGEDTIYVSEKKRVAVNKEVLNDEVLSDLGLSQNELEEQKAVEVGNIFKLGTRFSEPLGLKFKNEDGNSKPVVMGCYGIGPDRLMGTIVEVLSDEKGIVWPESVAPFKTHLLALDDEGKKEAKKYYKGKEVDVLYDDRDVSAGEKFADADLIGIPTRLVASKKSLAAGGFESKDRKTGGQKIIHV